MRYGPEKKCNAKNQLKKSANRNPQGVQAGGFEG